MTDPKSQIVGIAAVGVAAATAIDGLLRSWRKADVDFAAATQAVSDSALITKLKRIANP